VSAQRIRVWFRKGERLRYISHLDVLRFWERAIRRAGLPLAYSQGFTPHPKLSFASPLPLGFVGESEIMDVTLDERIDLDSFRARLAVETSEDLGLVAAAEVALGTPAPQACIAWADYCVDLPGVAFAEAMRVVRDFLARTEMAWTGDRREKSRTIDLRAGVSQLSAEAADVGVRLKMRVRAHQDLTIRPEDVLAALFPGEEATTITRTAVVLEEPSPARDAWRRRGRFEE
jgi:radical SAM-linked protein